MGWFASLWPFALQRLRHRWRLMLPLLVGAVLAVALLASVLVYGDAVRFLGLSYTLRQVPAEGLDVHILAYNASADVKTYDSLRGQVEGAVARNLAWFGKISVRGMRSATFFVNTVAPAGTQADTSVEGIAARETAQTRDNPRLRSTFIFEDGLAGKTTLTTGVGLSDIAVPMGPGNKPIGNPNIPAWITEDVAKAHGLHAGDSVLLTPYWESGTRFSTAKIAGIIRPEDPADPYWTSGLNRSAALAVTQNYIPLFVSEKTFQLGVGHLFPEILADYDWTVSTDLAKITPGNAKLAVFGLQRVNRQLSSQLSVGYIQQTALDMALQQFTVKDEFGRIPLLIVTLMIVAVILYYLVIVAGVVVRRQTDEMALLRSRGADPPQLVGLYVWESLVLSVVAFFAGPPLALAATAVLGFTPVFSGLTGGGALHGAITTEVWAIAWAGSVVALGAILLPALSGATQEISGVRASSARPVTETFFTRYYLDAFAAVIALVLFWEMTQRGSLVTESPQNGSSVDLLLLAAPALILTAVALVFLRIFPYAARLLAWLSGRLGVVWLFIGLREVGRNPLPYVLPTLLLMLASAIAMFAANFGATVSRSYQDRAAYQAGSPLRVQGTASALTQGDGSLAYRTNTAVATELFSTTQYDLLAVDPSTLASVAWFRKDFAGKPLDGLLRMLSTDTPTTANGVPIPAEATAIGLWAFPAVPVNNMQLRVRIADANGQYQDLVLGTLGGKDWALLSAALPAGTNGASSMQRPLRLVALRFIQTSGADPVPGAVYFDKVQALGPTLQTPSVLVDLRQPGEASVIRDDQGSAADSLQPSSAVTRSGESGAVLFVWGSAFMSAGRGITFAGTDLTAPLRAIISRTAAEQEKVSVGDRLLLGVTRHEVPIRVAEVVDFFPTLDPYSGGFIIVDMPALLERLNTVSIGPTVKPNEQWLAPNSTEASLATARAAQAHGSVIDQQGLLKTYKADPLTAAGWNGALTMAFFAVLTATLLGFSVYSLVHAQARRGQFALLRSLGASLGAVAGVVLVEQLIVIGAGMALGSWLGTKLTTLIMPFLGLTEAGGRVLPPFALQIDWPAVAVVYGIMGGAFILTTLVLIGVLSRGAIQRTLRFGEG